MKKIAVFLLVSTTSFGFADEIGKKFNLVDGYYFDWAKTNTAKCKKPPASIAKLNCKSKETSVYSPKMPIYSCEISEESEYLIFKSKSDCRNVLETLQANEP